MSKSGNAHQKKLGIKRHNQRWKLLMKMSIAWIKENHPEVWKAFKEEALALYPLTSPRAKRQRQTRELLADIISRRTPNRLTRREGEVWQLLCKQLPDKEIADKLCISVRTAKFHVSSVLKKLRVDSRHKL